MQDGSTAEILYYLGEYSIIRVDGGEDAISSDLIDPVELSNYIMEEI